MATVFIMGMVALQLAHLVMEAIHSTICHCLSDIMVQLCLVSIIAAMSDALSACLSSIFLFSICPLDYCVAAIAHII
jgi:hypothetical protein